MKIIKAAIRNFRNLDGLELFFDENCNFLVGENNQGKSNIISLFHVLFSSRAFRIEEFADVNKPIEVVLQIRLSEIEVGHFEDLFDLNDYLLINILSQQKNPDENIEFFHLETKTSISSALFRSINFIFYDSIRSPITEVNFDKGKGVGKFLKNSISMYLSNNQLTEKEFLMEEKLSFLINYINKLFSKIKPFKDFSIITSIDENIESLLSKILILKEVNGESLTKSGYGVQFLILILLSILERIQSVVDQKKSRGIFEDKDRNIKSISLILGLDEPEIHLHPYMQRSLVKYLNSIVSNKNNDFKLLIKEIFDIDEFNGQIIIATHSPSIILDDYKQILRLFTKVDQKIIISGSELNLLENERKHLYLHFPFIKESFFSRCVIFVEGDSEYGSFSRFAEKLDIDLDDLGICIIQARGDAIPQLMNVVNKFGIVSIGITDKDDGNKEHNFKNLYQTIKRNFEDEMISLIDVNKEYLLRQIIKEYDALGEKRELTIESLNKRAFKKYKIVSSEFSQSLTLSAIDKSDIKKLKSFYVTWFDINKSLALGKLIGDIIPDDSIPETYKKLLIEAKNLALKI